MTDALSISIKLPMIIFLSLKLLDELLYYSMHKAMKEIKAGGYAVVHDIERMPVSILYICVIEC